MLSWADCQSMFEPDGSLIDLYVLNTNLDDWRKLIPLLQAQADISTFSIDNVSSPFPHDIEQLIQIHKVQILFGLFGLAQCD